MTFRPSAPTSGFTSPDGWEPHDDAEAIRAILAGETAPSESPPDPADPLPDPTHFASPTGGGDGTEGSPFKVSDFWEVATAGDVLQLADGVYTGIDSMIQPDNSTAKPNGTEANPIYVIADTDGGVRINGEGVNEPILLSNNRYFIIQGIDLHDSSKALVGIYSGSEFNQVRRFCAWDAPDSDISTSVVSMANSWGNLVEDYAAFGNGRRMAQGYESGDGDTTRPYNVFRRGWHQGRSWDGSTKKVMQIGYQGYRDRAENCIGSFDAEGVLSQSGTWRGVFTFGRIEHYPDINSRSEYLGCIAYFLPGQDSTAVLDQLADALGEVPDKTDFDAGGNIFRDVVLYAKQNGNNDLFSRLQKYVGDPGTYENITEVGEPSGSSIASDWIVNNRSGPHTDWSTAPDPFQPTAGAGARVWHRTVDGILTSDPLWPWPMNDRINAALTESGRTPSDVFGGHASLNALLNSWTPGDIS